MKQSNVKAGVVVQVKKTSTKYKHFKGLTGTIVGLSNASSVLVDFSTETTRKGMVLHDGNCNLQRGVAIPTTKTCWYFSNNDLKIVKE